MIKNAQLPEILSSVTCIVNESLASGVFQGGWKQADLIPAIKDGDHKQRCNNRPISLLPVLSKVSERVASD